MENQTKQSLVELLIWAYVEGFKHGERIISSGLEQLDRDSLKEQFSEVLDKLNRGEK